MPKQTFRTRSYKKRAIRTNNKTLRKKRLTRKKLTRKKLTRKKRLTRKEVRNGGVGRHVRRLLGLKKTKQDILKEIEILKKNIKKTYDLLDEEYDYWKKKGTDLGQVENIKYMYGKARYDRFIGVKLTLKNLNRRLKCLKLVEEHIDEAPDLNKINLNICNTIWIAGDEIQDKETGYWLDITNERMDKFIWDHVNRVLGIEETSPASQASSARPARPAGPSARPAPPPASPARPAPPPARPAPAPASPARPAPAALPAYTSAPAYTPPAPESPAAYTPPAPVSPRSDGKLLISEEEEEPEEDTE